MPSNFPLAPMIPVPAPNPEFDPGIQFQQDDVDVGPRNPTAVSFNGANVSATYNPTTDTVEVAVGGSSSGGGGASSTLQGAFTITSDLDQIDLAAQGFTSVDEAVFMVWARSATATEWQPVLPSGNLGNLPGLATFAIVTGQMQFTGLSGFAEGGTILVRQLV